MSIIDRLREWLVAPSVREALLDDRYPSLGVLIGVSKIRDRVRKLEAATGVEGPFESGYVRRVEPPVVMARKPVPKPSKQSDKAIGHNPDPQRAKPPPPPAPPSLQAKRSRKRKPAKKSRRNGRKKP